MFDLLETVESGELQHTEVSNKSECKETYRSTQTKSKGHLSAFLFYLIHSGTHWSRPPLTRHTTG